LSMILTLVSSDRDTAASQSHGITKWSAWHNPLRSPIKMECCALRTCIFCHGHGRLTCLSELSLLGGGENLSKTIPLCQIGHPPCHTQETGYQTQSYVSCMHTARATWLHLLYTAPAISCKNVRDIACQE